MKQGQSFLFDELFLEIEEGRGDKSSCGQILILKEQPPPQKKTNPNSRGRWPPTIESNSVPKCLPLKRFFFSCLEGNGYGLDLLILESVMS